MGVVSATLAGAVFLSFSGMFIPKTDAKGGLSLKDVETRRTHYVRSYSLGK